MQRYAGLAAIYDYLVSGVDFEGWIDYLEEILENFGYRATTVLDLACGTGNTILPLARRGYNAAGLDLSLEMLAVAREKAAAENLCVEFRCADMRNFSLPRPVDLITCFHDGLNYLTDYGDLLKTFKCVEKNLNSDGLFVFDLNAVLWLSGTSPGTTVVEEDGLTLIWESVYHRSKDIWEVHLTGFARVPEGELYRKFKEVHRERAYRPREVEAALSAAGLKHLASYDAFTFNPAHEGSRRHFYVARKIR